MRRYILPFAILLCCFACKKNNDTNNNPAAVKINFIFKFDSTQARLNNLGNPSTIPAGNAAQSPRFNLMSAHYLELAPEATTLLGHGDVLYHAPEVYSATDTAIDFSQAVSVGNNEVFLSVPLSSVTTGTYKWLRVSLAYQNYNIYVKAAGLNLDATVASFIGYKTHINSYKIKDSTVIVNSNKLQGYWGFETSYSGFGIVRTGQAPPGATTVPNPLSATSPIPAGSCVVTGQFLTPLVITGNETADINIQVSLSTNKSFEWKDNDHNGTYDPTNPIPDSVVDMGIRGLIPSRL